MKSRRVTRWGRFVAVSSMATAMMLSAAACSSYSPHASEQLPEPGTAVPATSVPEVPLAGISTEEAQALLATANCDAGADPGDISWRDSLPVLASTNIAAAAYCVGSPLAVTMYDGDVAELTSLLARPDDTTPLQEGWACDDHYDPQPNLWIVTTEGALVQPRWPLDICGHLLQPVPAEILDLPGDAPAEGAAVPDEQVAPEEPAVIEVPSEESTSE